MFNIDWYFLLIIAGCGFGAVACVVLIVVYSKKHRG